MNSMSSLEDTIQLAVPSQPKEGPPNHLFADNLRFLSMAAVVAVHCIIQATVVAESVSSSELLYHVVMVVLQPFKFSIIAFFLVSGFLMGDRITVGSPLKYLSGRLRMILLPWLAWCFFYCAFKFVSDLASGWLNIHSLHDAGLYLLDKVNLCLFNSPYWFVPNLLLSLGVLLLCRRFIFDLRLGALLCTINVLYGVNIYTHWIGISGHSRALFGFTFYLWLGAWAAHHEKAVFAWIRRIPTCLILALVTLTFLAGLYEIWFIPRSNLFGDAINTMDFISQFFSLAMVLLIFKISKPIWPRFINVRSQTYGIYLAHSFVMLILLHVMRAGKAVAILRHLQGSLPIPAPDFALLAFGTLTLLYFLIVYGGSLSLTKLILRQPRLSWTVGYFRTR